MEVLKNLKTTQDVKGPRWLIRTCRNQDTILTFKKSVDV